MKVIIALSLIIAVGVALPIEEEEAVDVAMDMEMESGTTGWYVPQQDHSLVWMSMEDVKGMQAELKPLSLWSAKVVYHLYTLENPNVAEQIVSGDTESVRASHFNSKNPTRIIIHGWGSSADNDPCYVLRDAYFETENSNVICVDWSDKAQTLNYASSVMHVGGVGKQIANMIDFLHKSFGMSFETLHLTGHSLGAHVAGYAGKNVVYGRIGQITGLDPALPLFSYDKPAERLSQNDAEYVETIQTNGGKLGFLKPIGRSSFYPNGGKSQPGCTLDLTGACAHGRSILYAAEAIKSNNFPSVKCGDYSDAVNKKCGSSYSSVRMASPSNYVFANGHFFVPVNKKAPFGKGS